MESITIPKDEYNKMIKELTFLKDQNFIKKVNELLDILYQEKYNLVFTDYTDDLTEYSINHNNEWG